MTTQESQSKSISPRREVSPLGFPYDVDRLFDQLVRGGPFARFARRSPFAAEQWLPEVDVLEKEGQVVVRADLPGVKKEDVEVAVEGDLLTIRGSRHEQKETKEKDYYRSERSMGEFQRTIALPDGVTADSIKASYRDGVLEVIIPRPNAPADKRIQVEVQ
jgi:HSP20 family protein